MTTLLDELLIPTVWWGNLLRIALLFFAAWVVHKIAHGVSRRIVSASRLIKARGRPLRTERVETVQRLMASFVTFIAFVIASILALSLVLDAQDIIWIFGLFTAGFGFAARPLVSDFLTGIQFMFEDTFDVGEKIELKLPYEVSGLVEEINLRVTMLRTPSGDLYTIPNGEIRVVRNFSRGRFSLANVRVRIQSVDLQRTLTLLEALSHEAMALLPNLIEPWQVISETGEIGEQTELTLIAKARFAMAAEMRPRLLALVHERLAAADVDLAA